MTVSSKLGLFIILRQERSHTCKSKAVLMVEGEKYTEIIFQYASISFSSTVPQLVACLGENASGHSMCDDSREQSTNSP